MRAGLVQVTGARPEPGKSSSSSSSSNSSSRSGLVDRALLCSTDYGGGGCRTILPPCPRSQANEMTFLGFQKTRFYSYFAINRKGSRVQSPPILYSITFPKRERDRDEQWGRKKVKATRVEIRLLLSHVLLLALSFSLSLC